MTAVNGERTEVSVTVTVRGRYDGAGYGPPSRSLEIRRTDDPPGIRAAGEVYLDTHAQWDRTLNGLTAHDEDIHMDLSGLAFVDVAGASSLARAAQRLPAGRRIVVSRPPSSLSRALELFWPGLSAIEVVK